MSSKLSYAVVVLFFVTGCKMFKKKEDAEAMNADTDKNAATSSELVCEDTSSTYYRIGFNSGKTIVKSLEYDLKKEGGDVCQKLKESIEKALKNSLNKETPQCYKKGYRDGAMMVLEGKCLK